jgi:hypothetical protein
MLHLGGEVWPGAGYKDSPFCRQMQNWNGRNTKEEPAFPIGKTKEFPMAQAGLDGSSQPNSGNVAVENEGPQLSIPTDKVAFIIVKARAYDVKDAISDPNSGSNPTDDGDADVLEDKPDDLTRRELMDAIRGLNEDEQIELVALAWVGRGTFGIDEWNEALETARTEHNKRTAQYLIGLPLLGDYLEEGLAQFGDGISDTNETN